MSEWRIHHYQARCSTCGRSFEEGEAFFSLLFLEPEALRREDLCQGCLGPPGAGAGLVFWRRRHRPDRRRGLAVDFEALEELFLALDGRSEERLAEIRYLLALLLLRKKRLKLVGVRRADSGETLSVRRPRRAEEFEVRVFELDSERARGLQGELSRIFEGAGFEAILATPADRPEGDAALLPAPAEEDPQQK